MPSNDSVPIGPAYQSHSDNRSSARLKDAMLTCLYTCPTAAGTARLT
jgi:hypothetical protein